MVEGKPLQFPLAAVPGEGDGPGHASRFEITDEVLHHALEGDATGKLNVTIQGKPYVGTIEHHDHGHGDHGNGDHDEDGHHDE